MRTLILAALLTLTLTACGSDDSDEESAPAIADAERCNPDAEEAETVDFTSDESSEGPSSIGDRVGATSAVAGAQTASWDNFTANWSFSGASNRLLFTVDEG